MNGRVHGLVALLLLGAALPAAAEQDFERELAVEPGGLLRIEASGGEVEIESHDEAVVRVDARASGLGSVDFRLEAEGSELELRADRAGLSIFGGPRVRIRVRVPRRFSLDVETQGGDVRAEELKGSLRARTSGGRVEVAEIFGPVDLESSGGEIRAEQIEGSLRARTSGGPIQVSEVSGPIDVRTSGGALEIRDVRGPVDGRTSGGPIEARFLGPPAGQLRTSGGSIELEIPADAGAEIDARTSGGRVELDSDFTLEGSVSPERVSGRLNGGGARLVLETSGGNIVITGR